MYVCMYVHTYIKTPQNSESSPLTYTNTAEPHRTANATRDTRSHPGRSAAIPPSVPSVAIPPSYTLTPSTFLHTYLLLYIENYPHMYRMYRPTHPHTYIHTRLGTSVCTHYPSARRSPLHLILVFCFSSYPLPCFYIHTYIFIFGQKID